MKDYGAVKLIELDMPNGSHIMVEYFKDRDKYSIVQYRGTATYCPAMNKEEAILLAKAILKHAGADQ